jgi:hypothetical protein
MACLGQGVKLNTGLRLKTPIWPVISLLYFIPQLLLRSDFY